MHHNFAIEKPGLDNFRVQYATGRYPCCDSSKDTGALEPILDS